VSGIAFFDFDGTITTKDSLAEFIRFRNGSTGFLTGLVPLIPFIIGFKAGLMDRQVAKEKLLSAFFGGIEEKEFISSSLQFAKDRIPGLLRPGAVERLNWHKEQGHEVVIVSASPTYWLEPWCRQQGFSCIATRLEVVSGKITGRISGLNCHGEEKVKLIQDRYQLKNYSEIFAYGDSSGDKPMLGLAMHPFYKPFR
jgi:phosphatidylglycerophosphatase C